MLPQEEYHCLGNQRIIPLTKELLEDMRQHENEYYYSTSKDEGSVPKQAINKPISFMLSVRDNTVIDDYLCGLQAARDKELSTSQSTSSLGVYPFASTPNKISVRVTSGCTIQSKIKLRSSSLSELITTAAAKAKREHTTRNIRSVAQKKQQQLHKVGAKHEPNASNCNKGNSTILAADQPKLGDTFDLGTRFENSPPNDPYEGNVTALAKDMISKLNNIVEEPLLIHPTTVSHMATQLAFAFTIAKVKALKMQWEQVNKSKVNQYLPNHVAKIRKNVKFPQRSAPNNLNSKKSAPKLQKNVKTDCTKSDPEMLQKSNKAISTDDSFVRSSCSPTSSACPAITANTSLRSTHRQYKYQGRCMRLHRINMVAFKKSRTSLSLNR